MTSKKLQVQMHDPTLGGNWADDETYYSLDGIEPSPAEFAAADAACTYAKSNGAVYLESDKSSIIGNGVDAATITITFRLSYPDYIILLIAGQQTVVSFDPKGVGAPFEREAYITNLTSDIPGEDIVIEPLDWFAPDFPGGDPLVIEVTA